MERKIGEVFTYNGKTYKVVKTSACKDCAFRVRPCEALASITGTCAPGERTDNISVSFKEINNMEIKNNQLTIEIPEGMEIDVKNSDLTKGVVKFKKKSITYKDIEDALNIEGNRTGVAADTNNTDKLIALDKLMNIARYYNKDWKPDWSKPGELKYYIYYSYENDKYSMGATTRFNYGAIYFRLRDYIQSIIDNPSFRYILDTIYKD